MKYKTDAYELSESPHLTRHVKVQMPNDETNSRGEKTGRKIEAVMEYRQLLDETGKLLPNVTKIEPGYFKIE